jgi:hypothetical protein
MGPPPLPRSRCQANRRYTPVGYHSCPGQPDAAWKSHRKILNHIGLANRHVLRKSVGEHIAEWLGVTACDAAWASPPRAPYASSATAITRAG